MDSPTGRPSPRQLQGPRPTPLKVRKDSYKINKKPPTIPNPSNHPPQPLPPRPPVIIYTVSPKIIHTNPSDFMNLVQRLTGPNSDAPSPSAGALSPAARFAVIEKETSPRNNYNNYQMNMNVIEIEDESGMMLDRPNSIPGILSPVPSSLPPISPGFFSPSMLDPGSLSFLHDLSPGPSFLGNNGGSGSGVGVGGGGGNSSFMFSPGNLLSTPTIPSPGAYWELFNSFPDF